MFDTLSETKACDLLTRLFKARGYRVARNLAFREFGVSFHIDGWDAKARVGFEFLTSEDEDHDDLSLGEYKTLMAAQQRGELSLFIIDEVEPLTAADLTATVNAFLDEVEQARKASRKPAAGKRKPAPKSATKRPSARKGSVRKPADAKAAVKKATVKKATVKKATVKRAAAKPKGRRPAPRSR
jgi:hypothetical protein